MEFVHSFCRIQIVSDSYDVENHLCQIQISDTYDEHPHNDNINAFPNPTSRKESFLLLKNEERRCLTPSKRSFNQLLSRLWGASRSHELLGSSSNTVLRAQVIKGPYPEEVPGSGFGCENPCNNGGVNYVVRASIETYSIPGSQSTFLRNFSNPLKMFMRTFGGDATLS
jgi:hypothetical protein